MKCYRCDECLKADKLPAPFTVIKANKYEMEFCSVECVVETFKRFKVAIPPKIKIVEAGVDPNHQKEKCDRCGEKDCNLISTCSHFEYLTLCEECYRKAGNSVR